MNIKELKNKFAKELGYENWLDYLNYCNSNGFNEIEIGYDKLIKYCSEYYVKQALKEASEIKEPLELIDIKGNTKITGKYFSHNNTAQLNKASILNAYNLNNIK